MGLITSGQLESALTASKEYSDDVWAVTNSAYSQANAAYNLASTSNATLTDRSSEIMMALEMPYARWNFDYLVTDADDAYCFIEDNGLYTFTNTIGEIGCEDGASVFDGTQALVSSFVPWNGDITVSAWISTTTVSATETILQSRLATGYGLSVFIISGKVRFDFGGKQWTTSASISADTIYMITFTVDWDTGSVIYYLNGDQSSTTTITVSEQEFASYTWMGASSTNSSGPSSVSSNVLYGTVDDLRIYDRVLSALEVSALYANGTSAYYDSYIAAGMRHWRIPSV